MNDDSTKNENSDSGVAKVQLSIGEEYLLVLGQARQQIAQLQALVADLWTRADDWHGDRASSHYRSVTRERAEALGIKLS